MHETIESKQINDWLKDQPKNPAGQPLFKLSWCNDLYEVRKGKFAIYIANIFICEKEETVRTLKYNWITDRWILEVWFPPQLVLNPELPESDKGSYECIFVFEDSKSNPLPLNIKVVKLWVKHMMGYQNSSFQRRVNIQNEFAELDDKELKDLEDALDTPNIYTGHDILVPSNYPVQSPNLRRFNE